MAEKWFHSFSLFICLVAAAVHQASATQVAALYILGDSTVDVGNNKFLNNSRARADHPPYGIDFPRRKATGRFSNGLTTADFIAKVFKFKQSPPTYLYLLTKTESYYKKQILKGVNFAAVGAGLVDATTTGIYGETVPLSRQVQQFVTVVRNIKEQCGAEHARSLLSKSIIVMSAGKDELHEFFLQSHRKPDPALTMAFLNNLTNIYDHNMRRLLGLGVKKFAVINVPPLGCFPVYRVPSKGNCSKDLNKLITMFNSNLGSLLSNISSEFKGMSYSLGDAYYIASAMLTRPISFGKKA
ncbi:hypothetical protein F0562_026866 [Nyssa sinensis]|uniref:GDSL esterase/lipase n=1 Tax=Nyssa sinensis TaxID=561372 RepID=A0A5J5B6R1_9ASTE|nr:hypothetical protein F0562_026866 [Nyssa sinensis]